MAKNRVSLAIDTEDAIEDIDRLSDAVEDGASDAVRQLVTLAEGAMKKEAPEGTSTPSLRETIDTKFRRGGLTANVGARKKTADGGLLAEIIVEGTDASSYAYSPNLVDFLAMRLRDWADAKLGDPSAAYPVAINIASKGHKTLPNDFVDRSLDDWEGQVEDVAGEQIQEAMSSIMRGN